MMKKTIFILAALLIILTFASMTVLAQSGPAKGGKPTATPPPDTPPIPTEIPDEGTLYGDLYVILRDVNGVPVMARKTINVPAVGEEEAYDVMVACKQLIAKLEVDTVSEDYPLYPFSDADGFFAEITIPDGTTMKIYEGEPFTPPSYVDDLGDVVECELTEEMLDYVQSVDFGRLNLGRAPDAVINHAFDEAVNKFNAACDMRLDPSGRIMYYLPDAPYDGNLPCETDENGEDYSLGEWLTIDSPAENLALYIKMLIDGHWITLDRTPTEHIGGKGSGGGGGGPPAGDGPSTEVRPVLNDSAIALIKLMEIPERGTNGYDNLVPDYTLLDDDGLPDPDGDPKISCTTCGVEDLGSEDFLLAASLLAAAGDKTGNYSIDKVLYINSIYGITNWSGVDDVSYPTSFLVGGYQYGSGVFGGRDIICSSRGSVICEAGEMFVLELTGGTAGELGSSYTSVCTPIIGTVQFSDDPNLDINPFVEVYETVGLFLYTEDGVQKLYTAANEGTFTLTIGETDVVFPFNVEASVLTTAFGVTVTGTGTHYDPWKFPSDVAIEITDDSALSFVGEFTTNIRAFAKAADDALQVLEYIHNYRVPEDIYAP